MQNNTDTSDYAASQEDTMEGKYLIFDIADEEYGIPIRNVTEIIGIQSITDLPGTPLYVKGVINLRGKVVPVIDVRLRFSLPEKPYEDRTCIVVVSIKEISVGLIVDSVSEVMGIPVENIEPPPSVSRSAGTRYLQGLGKVGTDVKILIDTQRLLYDEDLEMLAGV